MWEGVLVALKMLCNAHSAAPSFQAQLIDFLSEKAMHCLGPQSWKGAQGSSGASVNVCKENHRKPSGTRRDRSQGHM